MWRHEYIHNHAQSKSCSAKLLQNREREKERGKKRRERERQNERGVSERGREREGEIGGVKAA